MSGPCTILILEDEPLIQMDLEYAAQDQGCAVLLAATCQEALEGMAQQQAIDVAILDVSLAEGSTCVPVARELEALGVPFLLHTGDLDRHEEPVRQLDAPLYSKPAAAEKVIAAALALLERDSDGDQRS